LIFISLRLFIVGHVGFRTISRVLGILQIYLGISKPPSPQTIINWVTRYALAKIWNYSGVPSLALTKNKIVNGAIWMIDTSIALGAGKILAVLEAKIDHFKHNQSAPTLENINCVAISVANSWTGESIADFLQQVIKVTGKPAAFLKDGGRDLMKGVRLLNERGIYSLSIDDVSHVVANLLKNEFSKHPLYEKFISACGQASKRFKQTILGFFSPPNASTKSRFMNIHRLVKWAEMVLKHSPAGRASKGSAISKLRIALGKLPECKLFIKRFLRDALPLLKSQEILKNRGLNLTTYEECKEFLKEIPETSSVRIGFITWMEKQLMVAESLGLGEIGMIVSSDNIESLFGIGKSHGTGEVKDANRIALRLPAFCGELTMDSAKMVLNVTVKQQQEIEQKLLSLTKQRRAILPNPGTLTQSLITSDCNLSLLPVPKRVEKSNNMTNILDSYPKDADPGNQPQNQTYIPNNTIADQYSAAS
ncbi:hypothetical protein, partial [Desulfamplus magnetovallimortis]|uniref:hypothetical protein n=1 Tax=Desulfamplus magnetovallimortis TaxID=1246637 RepID=UPI00164957BD